MRTANPPTPSQGIDAQQNLGDPGVTRLGHDLHMSICTALRTSILPIGPIVQFGNPFSHTGCVFTPMMQEIQEIGAKSFGRGSRVSGQSFVVLLALTRKPLTNAELHASFGMNPSEFGQLLDRLRRNRLVDVVSEFDGGGVMQTFCLTDEGERVLLREMEQMCELPER